MEENDCTDISNHKFAKSHMRLPGHCYEGKPIERNWISPNGKHKTTP